MDKNIQTALTAYFDYKDSLNNINGFSKDTITAKMMLDGIGNSNARSIVPASVKMTDVDFIELIDKVELGLTELKNINRLAYSYIVWIYRDGVKQSHIAKRTEKSERVLRELHRLGLKTVGARLTG